MSETTAFGSFVQLTVYYALQARVWLARQYEEGAGEGEFVAVVVEESTNHSLQGHETQERDFPAGRRLRRLLNLR